jgi:hypothetical protein
MLTRYQWLASARLFGVPSSLETPEDAMPVGYADMPVYRSSQELPRFFGDSTCTYGSELSSFDMDGRIHHTHYPINNGDILFAMHSACALIIQCVYEAKEGGLVPRGSLPTLRTYYDRLRTECKRNTDEWGNVYWPHDYYDAVEYWGYADWEYEEGCQVYNTPLRTSSICSHRFQKYLIDPLHDNSLTTFALGLLKPAAHQLQSTKSMIRATSGTRGKLESLPTEIIDQIVSSLPAPSALCARLVSSTLASKIPLNQRFFRERLIEGNLIPYIWDLDQQACRNTQRYVPKDEDADEYWDWRQLARDLGNVKGIVERDPDDEDDLIPRGFWNRCRLWLTVIEAELW